MLIRAILNCLAKYSTGFLLFIVISMLPNSDVYGAVPVNFPISLDSSYTMTHSGADTWYSFRMVKGQGISIEINTHFSSGMVDFHLYDSNMTNWDSITYAGPSYTPVVKNLNFSAQSTGTYYLKVTGNGSGQYDIRIQNSWYNPGGGDVSSAFTSSFGSAKYIKSDSYTFNTLAGLDVFRFVAKKGSVVSVKLTHNFSSGSANLAFYDKYGTRYLSNGYVGPSYASDLTLTFTSPKDDVYFFSVYSNGGAIVGSYTLAAGGFEADADSDGDGLSDAAEYFHGTDPGAVDTNRNDIGDADELKQGRNPVATRDFSAAELTNAITYFNAVPLKLNEVTTGVATGNDIWHSIELKKNQKVTFVLTGRFPSTIQPYVTSTSDMPRNLKVFNIFGYYPFSPNKNTDWFDYSVPDDGTYYIKIPASSANGGLGSYDIAVFSGWENPGTVDSDRIFRTSENTGFSHKERLFYSSFGTARYLKDGSYSFPTRLKESFFRFHATAGVPVSITLGANLTDGLVLGRFFDVNGNSITATCSNGYSCTVTSYVGPGYQSQSGIAFIPTTSGDYFFYVYQNGTTNGTFSLTSSGAEPPVEADDYGGDMFSASVIADSGQTAGKIQNEIYPGSYDEDVFKFIATRNGTYNIYTTGPLDTSGQVCDATGQTCDYDDDFGDYPNFLISKMMIAGEVAYIGVSSQLTSGSYTLHIDQPPLSSPASGTLIFTPIYPPVTTQASSIMQGGKVKRWYKLLLSLTGLPDAPPETALNYQICTTTILGTADCGPTKFTIPGQTGITAFETDWITDAPGTTTNRFVKLLDPGIVNTIAPSFEVTVYPRSLKEEISLAIGANVGGGISAGMNGGALGIGAKVELARAGLATEMELGGTISLDNNEFGTAYKERKKQSDNVILGFDVGFGAGLEAKVEGGPSADFMGQEVKILTVGGGAKYSNRVSRNDEFPEFFSTSQNSTEKLKADSQAYAFAGRLLNVTGISMAGGLSMPMLTLTIDYLLNKSGIQTDFRKEDNFEAKVALNASVSGPSIKTSIGDIKTIGVGGDVVLSLNEGKSLSAIDQYIKKRVELSYSTKLLSPEAKLKLPLAVNSKDSPAFNPSIKLSGGTGGRFSNEVTIKGGKADQIKLSMTTDLKTVEGGALIVNTQGIVENRISVYTTDPGYAQLLYDNHKCIGALLGYGLLGSVVNTPDFELIHTDLLSVLDYTNSTGLWEYVNNPLEYYNSNTETWLSEISLPFELGAGVYIEFGGKIGVVKSTSQIQTKGVSTVNGNFDTEVYQLDDSYVNSKRKGVSAVNAVYGKYIMEAANAVVDKFNGAIDSAKVALGNLKDGGIAAGKKVGDVFNWLNYKVHLATTKAAASGQKVVALQSAPSLGMTAKTVALAANAAMTIGQNHFVNVLDPNGVDLQTFPEPITISIGYKLADLTAAGLTTSDVGKLGIYRWDDVYGIWVYVGGTVDSIAQSVSIDITGKGSFILAIDTIPPVISNLMASDTTATPAFTATIKDSLSGINTETLTTSIDGTVVVNSTNLQSHFNAATGMFNYKPTTALASGTHTAIITVSDSAGNSTQTSLEFLVNALPVAITHTPIIGFNAGLPITVSASISGAGGISEAWLAYRLGNNEFKYQPLSGNLNTYSFTIPAVDTNGKQMSYYLYFKDSNGYGVYSPAQAPASFYSFPLNEGATRTIEILVDGAGTGTVNAQGLTCAGTRCTGTYAPGSVVSLTPAADSFSLFGGWTGDVCRGVGSCSVTMNSNLNVTAQFIKRPVEKFSVIMAGSGSGNVNSNPAGIACSSGSCSSDFIKNSTISLIPLPSVGSSFFGWSGVCSGSGNCSVVVDSGKSAAATFSIYNPIVMLDGQPPSYFTALSSAYATTKPASAVTMNAQEGDYDENLVMNNTVNVTFKGGFENTFITSSGYSRLRGNLTIASGSLTIDKLIIASSTGTVTSESSAVFETGSTTPSLYSTFKLAQDTIPDNGTGTIKANRGMLEGGLALNRSITLTLLGGFSESLTKQDGYLHIKGGLVIALGSLVVDNIILE